MNDQNKAELRRLIERVLNDGKEAGSAEYREASDALDEFLGDRSMGDVVISLLDEADARDEKARNTSLLWLEENAQLRAEVEALRRNLTAFRNNSAISSQQIEWIDQILAKEGNANG